MTDSARARLDRDGFVILERHVSPQRLEGLRRRVEELWAAEGDSAGSEFKQEPQTRRLANLVDKGEEFEALISDTAVLDCVGHVLGDFKLSSLNARSANPFSDWVQPLHCDMGAFPDAHGYWVCNSVWLLDDFTPDNGALRCVPGTHLSGKLPQQSLNDPMAAHPSEVLVLAKAGDVVVMNAHLWHGGTANRTSAHRRALHAFYCRRDKPQQQYQKGLLRPEVQARLDPATRRLLALDDAANDELAASALPGSGFLK